jgi:hypothetical protein
MAWRILVITGFRIYAVGIIFLGLVGLGVFELSVYSSQPEPDVHSRWDVDNYYCIDQASVHRI